MRILCVAEKPAMSKSIAQILSGGRFENNPTNDKYTRNYEFIYRLGNGNDVEVCMTAVRGHLTSLDFPKEYRKWYSCAPVELYEVPTVKFTSEELLAVERNLLQQAQRSQQVMIWTDCDREGENIGAEVASVCQKANPRIQVTRARFSSVTPNEINRAMRNPLMIDYNQANAVDARQEVDLRIGASFTRFQTMSFQDRYEGLDGVISYGSCQFPTVGFVVDQFRKVENFVPESFWKIEMKHCKDSLEAVFLWQRVHLFDQLVCLVIYETLLEPNNAPVARITKLTKKPTSKWRPLPLTTVELQKNGSKYLSISSDEVMKAAEKLYTQGWISYPRTETDQFDNNYDLMALVQKQTENGTWGRFAQRLVEGGYRNPRKGKNNDQAHPPIHPVMHTSVLEGNEKKVYEFVVRRFLACCSEDAKGDETIVEAQIKDEVFTTKGLIIKERNYLDVYPYDKWTGNELPEFVLGEEFSPTELMMKTAETSRPTLLTESQLIAIMDKNGIGTDATIAEHIKTVTERKYVMRRKREREYEFSPSTLGLALLEGYDNIGLDMSLSKPYLRAQLEANLKLICEGVKTKDEVVQEAIESYRQVFETVNRDKRILQQSLERHLGAAVEPPPRGQGGGQGGGGGGRGGGGGGFGGGGNGGGRPGPGGGAKIQPPNQRPETRPTGGTGQAAWKSSAPPPPPPSGGNSSTANGFLASLSDTTCNCADQPLAVERRVTKEGPNQGRYFYTCSKPWDEQCGFFKFTDDLEKTGGTPTNGSRGFTGNSNIGNTSNMNTLGGFQSASSTMTESFQENFRLQQQQNSSISNRQPRCKCGLVAKDYESPKNNMRRFWKCSKISKPCDYFQWEDMLDMAALPATAWSSDNNNNARRGGGGGASKADATCFKCEQKGHYASECSNSASSAPAQRGLSTKSRGKTPAKRGGSGAKSAIQAVKISKKAKPV
ncbi:DNA topoisomerase [Podila verticillata]|nr:DNA topoisomerase [Podila verticillata]